MRYTTLVIMMFFGVQSMATKNKKETKGRPKEPLKAPYVEYVTVNRYYPEPTGFLNPDLHIQAYRGKLRDGTEYIAVAMGSLPTPKPKTRIIDADENEYEVTETIPLLSKEGSPTICYYKNVKDGKKPDPAKEEPPKKPSPSGSVISSR